MICVSHSPQISRQVEIFSLQLLLRKFDITVCGFFSVDNSLLNMVISILICDNIIFLTTSHSDYCINYDSFDYRHTI